MAGFTIPMTATFVTLPLSSTLSASTALCAPCACLLSMVRFLTSAVVLPVAAPMVSNSGRRSWLMISLLFPSKVVFQTPGIR